MKTPEKNAIVYDKARRYASINFGMNSIAPVSDPCVNYNFLLMKDHDSAPELVLKVREGASSDFDRERFTLQIYKSMGINVPGDIHFDNTHRYWDTEAIVYEYVPNHLMS